MADLEFALLSNPDELRYLIGEEELSSFYKVAPAEEKAIQEAREFMEDPPGMGAEPPSDAEVFEQAPEEFFAAALDSLGPTPEEERGDVDDPEAKHVVDCLQLARPVRSQGGRGTCVAHAVGAVLECLLTRDRELVVDLSPQFLYWAAKHSDGHMHTSGTLIRVAADRAVSDGVCVESVWPYDPVLRPGNESHCPPPQGAVESASDHMAGAHVEVERRSAAAIRDLLDESTPVAFSIPVYSFWANPSGKVPMPIPNAPLLGGHAMCAVGYRIDLSAPGGGFFIAKNSWGQQRATRHPMASGYFDVPFAYIEQYGWESSTLRV